MAALREEMLYCSALRHPGIYEARQASQPHIRKRMVSGKEFHV
jgi:hypothetical protein